MNAPDVVILARAGSKGAPGKNWAMVAGRPCAWWTIDAALRASTRGRVVVSTDAPQVRAIAIQSGAEVVDRPPELAGDAASVDDAARHAARAADLRSPACVILYANVPVRPPGLIDRAVDVWRRTGCDSVQSYAPVGKTHPWWMARVDHDSGRVRPWEGDRLNHGVYRRQDLPEALAPDGGVLLVSRRALFLEVAGADPGPHAFLGADRRGVITEPGQVVDIDTPIDLLVADAILRSGASP